MHSSLLHLEKGGTHRSNGPARRDETFAFLREERRTHRALWEMWSRDAPAANSSQGPARTLPQRLKLQFSASSQVSGLRGTVGLHLPARPSVQDLQCLLLTQETQTAFWPEVESGREAFWEVLLSSGTSVGRRSRRDGSALPAPGLGLSVGRLHLSSQKPRAECAFGRFRQVSGKEYIAGFFILYPA